MNPPIYIQIHNNIKRKIEQNKWKIGDQLPSERELSLRFHVSRMTLRQAIQTLVDEGILEQRVGSGTFVANHKIQERMSGVTSFTDIMLSQNKKPSNKTIFYHFLDPSLSEAEKLKLKDGDKVLRMERIRYGNDVPICYEITTIPAKLVEGLDKKDISQSLYRALEERKHLIPMKAGQTISATSASEKIANYLNIKKGNAILMLRQITGLQDGTPFEYVRTQYVGERFEFYLEK